MKRISLSSNNYVIEIGPDVEGGAQTITVDDSFEAYSDCFMKLFKKPDDDIIVILEDEDAFNEKRKQKWDEVRAIRNSVIATTDWTQMPDVTMSDSDSTAWTTYRQELRDMIDEDTNPFAVTWPEKPV